MVVRLLPLLPGVASARGLRTLAMALRRGRNARFLSKTKYGAVGSLSHRYFVKTAISHAEKIRFFFPLAKMLSLTRGNFP
jgi:hypothetical protein